MQYSIIFLVDEENPDFCDFLDTICCLFRDRHKEFEILIVANGVEGFVRSQVRAARRHAKEIKLIAFDRSVSPSVCLKAALGECRGSDIMLAGSSQELASVSYQRIIDSWDPGIDIVIPYRKNRRDPFFNRLHSKALNKLLKEAAGIDLHDIGCQVKLFRREVLEDIEIYGNIHKYIAVLAAQKGFKLKEIECEQFDRHRETRYYSYKAYLGRLVEILNLFFSTRFSRKPLRFFNLLGSILIVFGIISLLYVGAQRILYDTQIGSRPLLIVALITLVGGAQIASFGLLGEIIAFIYGRYRKEYTIEKII